MSEAEQNLAGQQIQEEKLRRYLLGQCSANESAEIERAAFQDGSVSDALSVLEDELTDDYVCDQLNDFDRSCFELKFLTTSERREKVRLSALLLNRTEVLRRVPSGSVRADQLMSQEMKEAFRGIEDGSCVEARLSGGVRDSCGDALAEKMSDSIPIALRPAARRWKRWTALGAVAAVLVLVLVLYGIRVRLSAPTNPVITSAILRLPSNSRADSQEALHAYFPGSEQPTLLIVNGAHFAKGTIVQWDGFNLETTFVDSTKLVAVIPDGQLMSSAAKIGIVVVNPPPGGGPSPPFILTPNPLPSIASVDLQESDPRLGFLHPVIIVKGGNFTKGATVHWNGSNLETVFFVDSTTLEAVFPETDLPLANNAKIRIVVVNPPPGGGPSPPFIFSPTHKK